MFGQTKTLTFSLLSLGLLGTPLPLQAYSDNHPLNYPQWKETLFDAINYLSELRIDENSPPRTQSQIPTQIPTHINSQGVQIDPAQGEKPQAKINSTKPVYSYIRKLLLQLTPKQADWLLVLSHSESFLTKPASTGQEYHSESVKAKAFYMICERFNEIAGQNVTHQLFLEYRNNTEPRIHLQLASLLRNSSNPSVLKEMEKNLPNLISTEEEKFKTLLREISFSLCKTQEPWKIESILVAIAKTSEDPYGSSVVFNPKKPFSSPATAGFALIKTDLILPTLEDILFDKHKASQSPTAKYLSLAILKKLSTPEAKNLIEKTANSYNDEIGTYASSLKIEN